LQFRRSIYADPKSTDPDLASAKESDPKKQKFAQDIAQLDDKIFSALNIDVPEDLAQKLILKQSFASHRQQKKTSRIKLAIAASVAFAVGLTINHLQFSHAYGSIGDYAIAHVNHEAQYFTNQDEATVTLAALNQKMASFNGNFSSEMGELIMAEFCRFDGMKSLHLVYRGQQSPVNVFIVPNSEHLAIKKYFESNELNGVVNEFSHSNIIVVGDKKEPLKQWQNKINSNVSWSI